MATEITAAELLVQQCCDLKYRGEGLSKESAMAKYYCSFKITLAAGCNWMKHT